MSPSGFFSLLMAVMSCWAAPTLENDSCPRPERLEHAELQGDWENDLYPANTLAIYSCRPGYYRLGMIKLICINGKWNYIQSKGQCRKKSCGHPGDIPFGSFQLKHEDAFVFGAIVEYVCYEGYEMMSKETTRECRANGWSNHPPQCAVGRCQKPDPIKGTQLQGDWTEETYPPGKVANFVSESTQDGPIKMACVEGSWWHVSKGHCKDMTSDCTIPETSGLLKSPYRPSYQIGSEVIFLCKTGFAREGSFNSFCTKDGWNPPLPTCKEIQCTISENSTLLRTPLKLVYRENDDVLLRCENGFPVKGSNTVTCTRDGWSPPLPTCEDIRSGCTIPDTSDLVRIPHRSSYHIGTKVLFSCKAGLVRVGSLTSSCTKDGWNPPLPTCTEAGGQCGPPPTVQFGDTTSFSKTSYKSGESVEYKCPEYYLLQGNRIARCLNGAWEERPVCLEPCTAKETDMEERNIQLRWTSDRKSYITHGGNIEFVCRSGYEARPGTQMRIICDLGKLNYPKCFKIK